jgi:hypothetical protein
MTLDNLELQNIIATADKNKDDMRIKIEATSFDLMKEIDVFASAISLDLHDKSIAGAEDTRLKLSDLIDGIVVDKHKEIGTKIREWAKMKQIPRDHAIIEYIRSYVQSAVSQNIAYSIFAYKKSNGDGN